MHSLKIPLLIHCSSLANYGRTIFQTRKRWRLPREFCGDDVDLLFRRCLPEDLRQIRRYVCAPVEQVFVLRDVFRNDKNRSGNREIYLWARG